MEWFPTFRRVLRLLLLLNAVGRARLESESLLRILALAIEQRLALPPLLLAFSEDQEHARRWRIQRLAETLEQGTSLPDALEQIPGLLPDEHMLAIRFGSQSGSLSMTLRNLVENSGRWERIRIQGRLLGTTVYVGMVAAVITGLGTFFFAKIWPVIQKLMDDFAIESAAVVRIAYAGEMLTSYGPLLLIAGLLIAWTLWTERPGRVFRRTLARPWFDMRPADVLQNLSDVTAAGRPISGAISTLARYHYDSTLRRKLLFVRNEIEHGADVWATLEKVKLLAPAEVALIEASGRVGNRAWAMAELASSKRDRIQRRLAAVERMVEPVVVLLLAAGVLAMCLGVFIPLVTMILHGA